MLLKDAYCNHICIFLRENLQKKSMPPPHKDSVRDRFFTIHDSPRFGRLLFVILTMLKAKPT